MKYLISFLFLAFIAPSVNAQSKFEIRIGAGSQKYSGDLGNGFTLKNEVWRGSVNVQSFYSINSSFSVGVQGSVGDFGYCQPHDKISNVVGAEDRCPGCLGRLGLGNLSSRMYMAGGIIQYNFSNGYILKEDSRVRPFFGVGLNFNYLQDRMKMNCVGVGSYLTTTANIGVSYALGTHFSVGYSGQLGMFANDKLDFITRGSNDCFFQNNVFVGFRF
jgi:hypothetical protein